MPLSSLPRWVWLGASLLAFVAGIVNVVVILGFDHQPVTHLTGATTTLGTSLARLDPMAALHVGLVLLAFVAGCVVSGLLVQDTALRLGRSYGVALALEAVLLAVAAFLLEARSIAGVYLAAGASGLQNAIATTYSGAIVRTTHLTGMFTDLGIALGHVVRGLPVDGRRVRLCVTIISAFLLGATAGGLLFVRFDVRTLLLPAGLIGATAVAYAVRPARHAGTASERSVPRP